MIGRTRKGPTRQDLDFHDELIKLMDALDFGDFSGSLRLVLPILHQVHLTIRARAQVALSCRTERK